MRKGIVVVASVFLVIGCLIAWHSLGTSIEVVQVAQSDRVQEAIAVLHGPRVVALSEFDPQAMRMSYPAEFEGIPVLVGALGAIPTHPAQHTKLQLQGRVTIDFQGSESGTTLFEGFVAKTELPTWMDEVISQVAPWTGQAVPYLRCEIYIVGVVTMGDTEVTIPEGFWLIREQTHYMIRLTPCYPEEVQASLKIGEELYALGKPFVFHLACLKYSAADTVDKDSLAESSFFGVIEE